MSARATAVARAALLLWASFACAQSDPIEARYRGIAESLARAEMLVAPRPDGALGALADATAALTAAAAGGPIEERLPTLIARTRQAVTRGRIEEALGGVALLGGINQRLLFDAAVAATLEGRSEAARYRMGALARDLDFAEPIAAALEDPATPIAALRFLVEEGIAGALARRLAGAEGLDASAAYLTFVRGYATLLVVQESPRAPEETVARYLAGAAAAASDAPGSWRETAAALSADLRSFEAAASTRRATVSATVPQAPREAGAGALLPAVLLAAAVAAALWWRNRSARRTATGPA